MSRNQKQVLFLSQITSRGNSPQFYKYYKKTPLSCRVFNPSKTSKYWNLKQVFSPFSNRSWSQFYRTNIVMFLTKLFSFHFHFLQTFLPAVLRCLLGDCALCDIFSDPPTHQSSGNRVEKSDFVQMTFYVFWSQSLTKRRGWARYINRHWSRGD